jgi:hypothetical protein
VWIERNHHSLAPDGVGAFSHVPHYRLMGHVDPIEIPDAHYGRSHLSGNFVKFVEDLHRRSAP